MTAPLWLRAADCPLLQTEATGADPLALRLVQRLLELALSRQGNSDLMPVLLEEIAAALRADMAAVVEATPQWRSVWQYVRRGVRSPGLPGPLLSEVLDRVSGVSQPPSANQPAFLAACLSYSDRPNRVLLVSRPRDTFEAAELEYAVACGHYLGVAADRASARDQ